VSLKRRLRAVACCVVLEGAALLGVPMRTEQVQGLMRSLNEQKVAHTTPDEEHRGDGLKAPEPPAP